MIRTSEQTNELMIALAKAQAKFGAAIKGSINPAFRSKYADITSIIDATLEHLNAEGIVLMQHPSLEYKETHVNGEVSTIAFVTMTTRIQFQGQWMESDLSAPAMMRDRFDAQSVGSACTYLSRYQMQNILVVPREDDDGQKAVGAGTHEAAKAVGDAKVAKFKAAKKPNGDAPTALFYTIPEAHSGHFAEFINIKAYGSALNEVAAEGLRQLLKPYIAKVTKDETVLVSTSKMDALLEELTNNQVQYKLLEAR